MPVRHPRAFLTVAGQTLQCEEVTVHQTRDAKTDTLTATAALFGGGPGPGFWAGTTPIPVQCMITTGEGAGGLVFDGFIDSVDCDFTGGKVSVNARDKSAKMIDKKGSKKHLNKKPHEIVQQYASDNGLGADVDQVGEKAGRAFQIDYVALINRMSDWHAVQHIAEHYGMSAYSSMGKLYFKRIPETLPTYNVAFTHPGAGASQGTELKLSAKRNVTLGKTIKTTVHSWNHKKQTKFEGVYTEAGGGDTLEYHLHHPGLDQDQANTRAKSHSDKATKNEIEIRVEIPGDPSVNARMNLQLSGTGSAFDQVHEIQSVEHKISTHGGYVTTIDTKAKSKKRGEK